MRIGLALGSGAARGWAHLGVLRALAEGGIEPDVIAGTSVGALVGGAWLTDQVEPLSAWARSLGLMGLVPLLDLTLSRGGLLTVSKLFDRFRNPLTDVPIETLRRPFGVVATELSTGREVWIREGPMLEAVHASVAIPGLIPAVRHEDRWLVDGALVNPVPVSLARAMGATVVIAVNLNGDLSGLPRITRHVRHRPVAVPENPLAQFGVKIGATTRALAQQVFKPRGPAPGVLDALAGSLDIMQDRITRARLAGEPADVVITPPIGHIGVLDFDQPDELVRLGYEATVAMRPAIDLAVRTARRIEGPPEPSNDGAPVRAPRRGR